MLKNNNIIGFGRNRAKAKKIDQRIIIPNRDLCILEFSHYPHFCKSDIAQLTPGYFSGEQNLFIAGGIAGMSCKANQTYMQQITIDADKFIFGFCGTNESLFINGRLISANEIFVLTPKITYDLVIARNTTVFAFSLGNRKRSAVWPLFEQLVTDLVSYKNPVLTVGDNELRDALIQQFISADASASSTSDIYEQAIHLLANSPHSHYRPNSRSNLISRTLRLMHAKPFDMRKISDIANACFVSQRGLEKAFDSTLNNSPGEYLKAFQLNVYRKAIINEAISQTVSLSDIALSLGAINYSRLSKDYKSFFGELPSVTRRRYG